MFTISMLTAIDFNDQESLAAGKVGEEGADRQLPDELVSAETPRPQFAP